MQRAFFSLEKKISVIILNGWAISFSYLIFILVLRNFVVVFLFWAVTVVQNWLSDTLGAMLCMFQQGRVASTSQFDYSKKPIVKSVDILGKAF